MGRITDLTGEERGFAFSGAGIDRLGSAEYTIVSIAVDESGSVESFKAELEGVVTAVAQACQNSPRGGNILMRVSSFGGDAVREISGFVPPGDLGDVEINPGSMTPLYDGIFDAIAAVGGYGKNLADADYFLNGIVVIVTDGGENSSREATAKDIKQKLIKLRAGDDFESLRVILVGVNADYYQDELQELAKVLGLDQFITVDEATPEKLMKLANFISQSVQAQSMALGSGGPSQPVALQL